MKLTPEQLTALTILCQALNQLIAQAENLNIRAREISLTQSK